MKRLEGGSFQHPHPSGTAQQLVVDTAPWHLLLSGLDLQSVELRKGHSAPDLNQINEPEQKSPS